MEKLMEEFLAAVAARVVYLLVEAVIVRLIRAFTATQAPVPA
jgi:hypothetical protein